MPMPRIAPLDPPYPDDVQSAFDKLMRGAPPLLLFRTVARNPRVLQRMMAGGLLDRGSIPLRSRELMILRTCAPAHLRTCAPARAVAPSTSGASTSLRSAPRRGGRLNRLARRFTAAPATVAGTSKTAW